MTAPTPDIPLKRLFADHSRHWRQFDYVYPVISRRSKGLSIGVNLNPDKVCNWDCVYCQVDRTTPGARKDVDLDQLRRELDWMLDYAVSGEIWSDERFLDTPPDLRRINDIAIAGDGEPTTFAKFDEACRLIADVKHDRRLDDVKIILLTNMSMAHRPAVQRGLDILDQHQGEIWAKLDAGTQAYFQQVDRAVMKLPKLLGNILATGRVRPIVIQSLFMRLHGQPTPADEIDAYIARLAELTRDGCRIKLVQLYTIARATTEPYATPLSNAELDALAARCRQKLPDLRFEVYYGIDND